MGYEQKARNAYQEKLQKHQKEADALLNKREYKDLTKTILTKDMFDNNLAAVKVEIDRVKKLIPNGQKQIKDYNNRLVSVAEYKTTLQNAYEHMNRMVFVTKSIIENNDNLLKNLQGSLDNAIQLSSYAAEEFRNLIPAPPKQQK